MADLTNRKLVGASFNVLRREHLYRGVTHVKQAKRGYNPVQRGDKMSCRHSAATSLSTLQGLVQAFGKISFRLARHMCLLKHCSCCRAPAWLTEPCQPCCGPAAGTALCLPAGLPVLR